jgi:hypothetical protein
MRRLAAACVLFVLAGCAAGGTPSSDAGGTGGSADSSTGTGAGGNPTVTSVGSGAAAGMCTHATYTYYGPGVDGIVGTNDDVATGSQDLDFAPGPADVGSQAHPTALLEKDAMGQPTLFEKWVYDANGIRQTITQYAQGPDGQFDTPDDAVQSINQYKLDAAGLLKSDLFHGDAGLNGSWGDDDDTISASIYFLHDRGRLVWALPGSATGPNGVWGDADDLFLASERLEYDDDGRLTAFDFSNIAGPDGAFGTDDDVIVSRTQFPCRGDRVVMETYDDPGFDKQWGTSDDALTARVIESGDICSTASCEPAVTPW